MRNFVALFVVALPALAAAQFATDCGNATQATFNLCVSNGILDGNKLATTPGTTIENACNNVRENQALYYCCLCNDYTAVQSCYNQLCTTSPSISTIRQQTSQYCDACVPANTVTRSTSLLPFPTLSGTYSTFPTASSTAAPDAISNTASATATATAAAKNDAGSRLAGLSGAVFGGVVGLFMA
ncbi:uncharacterized protein EV422DRAFT_219072 [Fimicolochytrium jonesii]|uniref:uncharacterized protein n=1 Tax=Fimicolochytrium jonesii TaxID=1396493 RepID=UPI0022FDC895|nr:uncharacterized protein EV422DRAFT_219072 [Fimicolochytrium jonesii]KAI8817582.1 hypothetical protein EV422DRAFT_219072 [Fimicolochytrium jonesii]